MPDLRTELEALLDRILLLEVDARRENTPLAERVLALCWEARALRDRAASMKAHEEWRMAQFTWVAEPLDPAQGPAVELTAEEMAQVRARNQGTPK